MCTRPNPVYIACVMQSVGKVAYTLRLVGCHHSLFCSISVQLMPLWVHATIARLRAFQLENTLGRSSETGVTLGIDS